MHIMSLKRDVRNRQRRPACGERNKETGRRRIQFSLYSRFVVLEISITVVRMLPTQQKYLFLKERQKRGQISPNPALCSLSTPSPFSASTVKISAYVFFILYSVGPKIVMVCKRQAFLVQGN